MNKHNKRLVAGIVLAGMALTMGCEAAGAQRSMPAPQRYQRQVQSFAPVVKGTPTDCSEDDVTLDLLQVYTTAGILIEVPAPCLPVVVSEPKTSAPDYTTDRELLKRVVIAEAGGEGLLGMKAVAQVIYDRLYLSSSDWNQDEGLRGVLTMKNQFAAPYRGDTSAYEPNISEALESIFDKGERVFDDCTVYFYNPKYSSEAGITFMESQKYVGTIGGHVFMTGWNE